MSGYAAPQTAEVQMRRLLEARDRVTRRLAAGETAELLGPLGIDAYALVAFASHAEHATAGDPPYIRAAIVCGFMLALELAATP